MNWQIIQNSNSTNKNQLDLAHTAFEKLKKRTDLGFLNTFSQHKLFETSLSRAQDLRRQYKTMAVLGMGGSSLGARAILEMCQDKVDRKVLFFDNVDSHRFYQRIEAINNLEEVHWVIISKSGNTIETLNMANFIDQQMNTRNQKFHKHCTVITEDKSNPLKNWALTHNVPTLELPQDIGGRFSVFTPVGLLPAAFAGLNIDQINVGIQNGLKNHQLVSNLSAQMLQSFQREEWISVQWPYCDDLKEFCYWFSQLWAESLAKVETRDSQSAPRVSTPVGYIGASDQHSVLQQVAEGTKDKFVIFYRVKRTESAGPKLLRNLFAGEDILLGHSMGDLISAEAQATQESLTEKGVSTLTLSVQSLDEATSAELMQTWMVVVGILGEALNINAFNQPGVESGKVRAKQLLKSLS